MDVEELRNGSGMAMNVVDHLTVMQCKPAFRNALDHDDWVEELVEVAGGGHGDVASKSPITEEILDHKIRYQDTHYSIGMEKIGDTRPPSRNSTISSQVEDPRKLKVKIEQWHCLPDISP